MKKVLSILFVCVMLAALFVPVASANDGYGLWDNAGLLSESEYNDVYMSLSLVSDSYNVDVAVITVDDFSNDFDQSFYDIDDAAEYLCKNVLDNKSNVLLMISMANRDWCIAVNEKGHDAFTAYGREYIGDAINEELHDGDYADAFRHFANLAGEFLAEAQKGTPYDTNHKKMTVKDYLISFGIPLGVGLVIAFLVMMSIRKKYKPVQLKAEANDYLIQGSMQLRQSYDHFIYTHVSRTRRQKSSSSSSNDSGSFGSTSGKF